MRQDDPAEPAQWAKLKERLKQCGELVSRFKDRDKRRKKLLSKIKYHVKRIQADPDADPGDDWRPVIEAADQLVDDGVPPSNSELRSCCCRSWTRSPRTWKCPRISAW